VAYKPGLIRHSTQLLLAAKYLSLSIPLLRSNSLLYLLTAMQLTDITYTCTELAYLLPLLRSCCRKPDAL
jgi:hypothetical protein